MTEVKYAVEDSLKWDLPQHFKTRTQKSDYSRLHVKRSSMTLFAIEEFDAFISEQVEFLPGPDNGKRRTYRGEDLEAPEAIQVTKPRIREAKAPRTPSPKYFCQNCKADLCRDCFKVDIRILLFLSLTISYYPDCLFLAQRSVDGKQVFPMYHFNTLHKITRPAFNNVKDWYFVLDWVQFRTGLGCVRLKKRIVRNQQLTPAH